MYCAKSRRTTTSLDTGALDLVSFISSKCCRGAIPLAIMSRFFSFSICTHLTASKLPFLSRPGLKIKHKHMCSRAGVHVYENKFNVNPQKFYTTT